MIRIPVSQLQPGMICAAPVRHVQAESQVLLQPDFPLKDDTITRLARLGVAGVWVRHPQFEFLDEQLRDEVAGHRLQLYQVIQGTFSGVMAKTPNAFDPVQFRSVASNLIMALLANKNGAVWADAGMDGQERLPAHCANVAYLSLVIGLTIKDYIFSARKFVSYSEAVDVTNLGLGAMLHDLGKLGLDPAWHDVHGFEPVAEDPEYQSHVERGYRAVQGRIEPTASQILLHHHQRFDGKGFPKPKPRSSEQEDKNMEGANIHVFSRVVAVANAIDAVMGRCRARRQPTAAALHALQQPEFSGAFDPVILDAALRVIPPYPLGAVVELSDGRQAVVTGLKESRPCHPTVCICGSPLQHNGGGLEEIDLATPGAPGIIGVDGLSVGNTAYTLPEQPLRTTSELPSWLRTALNGETTDVQLNDRREPRRIWVVPALAKRLGDPASSPLPVRTLNVSRNGVGFVSTQRVRVGERLAFAPQSDPEQIIRVRVVHCTPITQGFQIGCVFE